MFVGEIGLQGQYRRAASGAKFSGQNLPDHRERSDFAPKILRGDQSACLPLPLQPTSCSCF